MRIYKFGGASVMDAKGVKNAAKIICTHPDMDLVVVVSAMGKMTNALENIVHAYRNSDVVLAGLCDAFFDYHKNIARDLKLTSHAIDNLQKIETEFKLKLKSPATDNYDYDYDQIVSFGEVFSSVILSEYLNAL